MVKRKHKKIFWRWLSLILLISCAAFAYNYYRAHRTIPDYAPPTSQTKQEVKTEETAEIIVAVGDIVCSSKTSNYNGGNGNLLGCHQKGTAELARKLHPEAILALGDLQYENGELSEFQTAYAASWGVAELKNITKPTPGNHEYNTRGASGYYQYFGSAAGEPNKGYYSFDQGKWHIISLNSNCAVISCRAGSAQHQWLAQDLASHTNKCTIAYWHHPIFSSGEHGSDSLTKSLYQALLDAKADVVLAGHDHLYERFAKQDASGVATPAGIRNFIVGTGGKSLYPFRELKANSEVRLSASYGVLKLILQNASYHWEFITEDGRVLDSGSDNCV